MRDTRITEFWQAYLDTLPPDSPVREEPYIAEGFGDTTELTDELGELVLQGVKTATCSSLWEWEAEAGPLPRVGLKTVLLDGSGRPLCIVETTEVTVRPFREVDEDFAVDEGEDDRSLASWRDAHWRVFTRLLKVIGRAPTEDMPLVCERFRRIYP